MPTPKSAPNQEQALAEKRFPIKRFITFFLLLTACGLGIIIYQAGGSGFLVKAIHHLLQSPWTLVTIAVLLCIEWYSDYLRYFVLARHLGVPMPFGFGIQIVFANLFFSYLTPGGTFGAPVTIYMMYKKGIPVSKSIALALIKPFLTFFVMLASGSIVFLFADFPFTAATKRVLLISSGVVLVLTLLVAGIVFFPKFAHWVLDTILGYFRKLLSSRGSTETPRLDRWEEGIRATIEAFSLFGKSGWIGILEGLATTTLNLVLFIYVSVVLLRALGFKNPSETLWLYSYIYYFLIAFAPTPGASGLAEGGGYFFFQGLGQPDLVSSYVVFWRFLSCYLVMVIGASLFLRFLRHAHTGRLTTFQELGLLSEERESVDSLAESSPPTESSSPPDENMEEKPTQHESSSEDEEVSTD